MTDIRKSQLIRHIMAEVGRHTGRRYRIDWALLDEQSLHELVRLLSDLDAENHNAVRRAQLMPWRHR
jgi:hypothetical protein